MVGDYKMSSQKKAAKLRVVQTASPIGRIANQRKILVALGLNKINRVKEFADSPSIRGMIKRVSHLVKVEEI